MKIFNSGGGYDTELNMRSVFLAGPTLRGDDKNKYPNWRNDAVQYFQDAKFDGALYIPEPMKSDYGAQIDWEVYHLERATAILFWVPRSTDVLPGFTTNIEFGEWMRSGKIVLGCPPDAEKMRYLIYRAKKYGAPVLDNLQDTVNAAIDLTKRMKE